MHLRTVAAACAVALLACDSEPSDTSVDDTSVADTSVDDTSVADTSVDDTSVDDTTQNVDDTSADDTSVADTTAETDAGPTGGGCASDLFFSEYIEGSGSVNKVLEVANFTGAAVDLADYEIWGVQDGGTFPEDIYRLSGTLPHGKAAIFCNGGFVWSACTLGSPLETITEFDGDDPRALVFHPDDGDAVILDVIGVEGPDPGAGFNVAGVENATANHTLRRKPGVTRPNADWASSAGTDAESSEWVVLDIDTLDGVDAHTYEGTCP